MVASVQDTTGSRAATPTVSSATWLLAICAAGAVLRALTLYRLPNIAGSDETFQYVEQASRLLGGHALVPWEYQVGARSWLLPLFLTPAVALGRAVSTSPDVVYGCVWALMIALASAAAVAAYRIGRAVGSQAHGLFAALLVSLWCEEVYLSPHALADTISASLLLIALAASLGAASARRLAIVGLLLGATFVVRLQLAPALGLIGLAACWRAPIRRGLPTAIGFLAPLLVSGLLDWLTWGAPFRSLYTYFVVNQAGVASSFGVQRRAFYIVRELQIWGYATPLILLTAALGARRAPVAAAAALAIVATLSLVPHKEYRFLFPAVSLLMVLCGLGAAELASYAAKVGGRRAARVATAALVLGWSAASLARGASAEMRLLWTRQGATLKALAAISHDPTSCGLGVAPGQAWYRIGASRLRADIPQYLYSPATTAAFNYVLAFDAPAPAAAFRRLSCDAAEGFCLYRRAGGCAPAAGLPLTAPPPPATLAVLQRLGLMRGR
jgi:hypothetical protein